MSNRYVVDTNIPIVANRERIGAAYGKRVPSFDCQLAAISFLEKLIAKGRIVLDVGGEIQSEYHRYLNPKGQPGVGDRFYQLVLNSAPSRVERVILAKTNGEYDDFPNIDELAAFDKSDRKFVAVALKSKSVVANAVDGDWVHHRRALASCGVKLKFICGLNRNKWFGAVIS